ncbi:hypothetical protein FQN57_002383 [Myotisia sp. PD_48]|nr:hypothetical protein FQN57_002383 [Myotisia sp. PD_48]
MAGRTKLLTSHPFKALYTIFFAVSSIAKLPFVLLYYLPSSLRPLRTWSYITSVRVWGAKQFLAYASAVELQLPVSLEPGKEGDRFITITPRHDDLYNDALVSPQVKPQTIGGVWYPTLYSHDNPIHRDKKIILHMHGGAFVISGVREQNYGRACRLLSNQFDGAFVLCPQYRLASAPNGHFPAQLQDAVTAYRYLVEDLHIEPSRIVLSGDSAGGVLALGTIRHIVHYCTEDRVAGLPLPAAVLLWSPWVNVSKPDHVEQSRNKDIDFIRSDFLTWGTDALTDNSNAVASSHPYVSPLQSPFKLKVPLWVCIGTAETFYESVLDFVNRMKAENNIVKLYEIPDAPHDTFALGVTLAYERELAEGMKQAWEMIRTNSW